MENSKATIQRSLKRKHNLFDNRREKMELYKIIKTRDDGEKSMKDKRKTGQRIENNLKYSRYKLYELSKYAS